MKRRRKDLPLRTAVVLLFALALLLLCGAASADGPHTVLLRCDGSGFVGITQSGLNKVTLIPNRNLTTADGKEWTLEALLAEPGFRLVGATLRFTVAEVEGANLPYSLSAATPVLPLSAYWRVAIFGISPGPSPPGWTPRANPCWWNPCMSWTVSVSGSSKAPPPCN